jgi:3-hydroxy-9,10-secoandrosta-1,3,5(10)-triene-9,17-dione monooxygenase
MPLNDAPPRVTPTDYRALLENAERLVPALRARAARAEAMRAIPDETIAELHEAGLFRIFQPERYGGYEVPIRAAVEVAAIIARGCASTSWVLMNLVFHNWMLGFWPAEAQDEMWADDPTTLIGATVVFRCGRARRVEGGYRLSGRWPFSSGIDPSRWSINAGIVCDDAGRPLEHRYFLLPQSDYTVIDNWQVMGLAATGSKDVEVDDAFVPEHRTLGLDDSKTGAAPGTAVNPGPLYRLSRFGLSAIGICGTALGIAQAVVQDFTAATRNRLATYSGRSLSDLATMQMRVAEAATLVDAAEVLLLKDCDEGMAIAASDRLPTMEEQTRWRRDIAFACGLCTRAVDLVFAAAGGGAIFESNPLQRAHRDIHAAHGHIGLSWDFNATMYGRVALGLPADVPNL